MAANKKTITFLCNFFAYFALFAFVIGALIYCYAQFNSLMQEDPSFVGAKLILSVGSTLFGLAILLRPFTDAQYVTSSAGWGIRISNNDGPIYPEDYHSTTSSFSNDSNYSGPKASRKNNPIEFWFKHLFGGGAAFFIGVKYFIHFLKDI